MAKWSIVAVLMLATPAYACDWEVSKQPDPMSDKVTCTVSSEAANIAFYRYGSDRPNVATHSAYSRDGLKIRIDDRPAILMGNNAGSRQKALAALLPQIETGQRIRVSFMDYPTSQSGDAPICNLPALLRSCTE